MMIRAYLRASTDDQDANRARAALEKEVHDRGLRIASYHTENESGATLHRPKLFELLEWSQQGDVLLVEQVDRLSRLNAEDWEKLKAEIHRKGVRVVALDLPTSWMMIDLAGNKTSGRMLKALNEMMLNMLAAVASKDYEDRQRRQAEGIRRAKAEGKYKGRPANAERHQRILRLLDKGMTWSDVTEATGASRSTISRVLRERREKAEA